MNETSEQAWSTRTLLAWIEGHLKERSVDEPALVARWLMARAIDTDPIHLYTDLDRPASPQERTALRDLVRRAAMHEPVQYLLGEGGFLGRQFEVGPGVLIPRTATEGLVQHVLTWHRGLAPEKRPDPLWIADIGTGTGCIAVTLALQLPTARVVAVDVSAEAVSYAARNVAKHGIGDRVEVAQGDLCEPLPSRGMDGRFHVIVSNPPYVDDDHVLPPDPTLTTRGMNRSNRTSSHLSLQLRCGVGPMGWTLCGCCLIRHRSICCMEVCWLSRLMTCTRPKPAALRRLLVSSWTAAY